MGAAESVAAAAQVVPGRARRRRLTILVSGMIAGVPHQGGATWAVLQYLLGFRLLGHRVFFVEPLAPEAIAPAGFRLEESENASYFRRVMADLGFTRSAALLQAGSTRTVGLAYDELREVAARADLLINISGMLEDPALLEPIARRAYLDLDPGFVQLWSAVQGIDMRFDAHTHFATIGLSIGRDGCAIPTCGRAWIPTCQPVVLDFWPGGGRLVHHALTTVGNWRGYGSIEHEGRLFGQKAHSLRQFLPLPQQANGRFRLALTIHPGETHDLAELDRHGWELLDPAEVAACPWSYRHFVRSSWAEFGVAKSGYAEGRCGWFSDRSICYLASGRPVIAQETGFSDHLPVGEGLFAFSTLEQAADGVEAVRRDYAHHSRTARRVAEEHFDAATVLPRLLERLEAPL